QGCGDPVRQVIVLDQVIHAIHTDHDQLRIADPGHIDDAEDQVEPERKQRKQAAEQDAVDHGLQEIDIEEIKEGLHVALSSPLPLAGEVISHRKMPYGWGLSPGVARLEMTPPPQPSCSD